jgi:thioredoxin-like negative regulator of GroEL
MDSEETEENTDDGNSPKLKDHELIESFLEKDQQRTQRKGLQLNDEDVLNDVEGMEEKKDGSPPRDEDSYFTETLARIYIRQKRYEKALQIIKNLSLKYPEKNVYLADQIRFLEKLIINIKK